MTFFDSLGIIWWLTSCLQYHKDYCLTSFLRTFKSRTISDTSVLEFNTAHSSIHDNTFKFSKIIHHRSGKFDIFEASSIVYLSPWLVCWSVLGRSRCHGNSSRCEASSKSWDMPWSGQRRSSGSLRRSLPGISGSTSGTAKKYMPVYMQVEQQMCTTCTCNFFSPCVLHVHVITIHTHNYIM